MSYQDNNRGDRTSRAGRDGMGGGTIAIVALGGFLVVGGLIYAMSGSGNQRASNTGGTATTQSPPATVGGGGAPASSGNAQRP